MRLYPGFALALATMVVLAGCQRTVSQPYYLILDRAVKEYFLPDGDKSTAIQILQEACADNSDNPDLLCYNAGVLLLREGRPEQALDYFERALDYKDIPLYRSAVASARLQAGSAPGSDFQKQAAQIIQGCRNQESAVVADILSALESDADSRFARFVSQPLIEQCLENLAKADEMAQARNRIQSIRDQMPDYQGEWKAIQLSMHPLNRLWNPFWKYGQNPGNVPAVQAWAATLDAARSGSAGATEQAARRFFGLPELTGSDQGVALRRAGALLILQDPFFDGVRSGGLKALAQSNL
ncbi:MAG: hypothetical protein CMN76_00915 [Spirochaetaceae bacterium]|nr:hypothetical protein [Spirochaetaceae bacterium]